jgi:hypothetical protein
MNTRGNCGRVGIVLVFLLACVFAVILVAFAIYSGKTNEPPSAAAPEAAPAAAPEPAPVAVAPAPASPVNPVVPVPPPPPVPATPLEQQWGIQVSSLGLALNGAALRLRYKVVAPDKVALLVDDSIPAYLVDQASDAKTFLRVPTPLKTASAHSRAKSAALMGQQSWGFPPPRNKLMAEQEYSLLLPNTGGAFTNGSKVTLVLGDVRADSLTVQ